MHTVDIDFDLSVKEMTKVEGSAGLDVKVSKGKVEYCHFKVQDQKRFYTEAIKGKHIMALPQLLSRICGTCSNAHLLCSIEACEKALGIVPTPQTIALRELTYHGLIIRDHALHLYLFAMPDIFGKDNFLAFDESDPQQHQMLHDGFDIKSAGNFLATLIAGRSVHALYPTIGGYTHFPDKAGIETAIKKIESIRPAVLRCIEVFKNQPFHLDRQTKYMALVPSGDKFGYLDGCIMSSTGECIQEPDYRAHLEHVVLPYSTASGYEYKGESYMVGALARMNLAKDKLHPKTKESLGDTLNLFPATDIYMNNLAQAIGILHSVDESLDMLRAADFKPEPIQKPVYKEGVGVGVIEAPRGTLYHKVHINDKGVVTEGEIIVPTGQNQINIENDVKTLIQNMLDAGETDREKMHYEIEKMVRAYDPCMSCAAHFIKVKWDG